MLQNTAQNLRIRLNYVELVFKLKFLVQTQETGEIVDPIFLEDPVNFISYC